MSSKMNQPLMCVIIDDDKSHRYLLRAALETVFNPSQVEIAEYERADEALVDLPPDRNAVILCDYQLGASSGVDWLPDFVQADIGPVIMVTSSGNQNIASEAFRNGAADYVEKSTIFQNPDLLKRIIAEARRKFKFTKANKELSRKLKMANRELEQKNKTLAQLTETAHRFVDDVAHEFRTPLAVIKEFASIINDGIGGEVNEKQSEFLGYINDASTDLAALIDDFLDSSKLRARTLRVQRNKHSVEDLFDSVWPTLENRAGMKSILIDRRISDGLPDIYADADKVKRSLINLVINAVKFSNPGDTVTLAAELNDHGKVLLSVIDHGAGLPQEEAEKLFDRFKQNENAGKIDSKGFGLGLNIVKEMVAINLGEVFVQSEYGSGSTFSFTVPRYEPECIVDSMIERMNERNQFGTISVFKISISHLDSVDDVVSFLSCSCYPTDLVMTSGDQRFIYVMGETIEPECWLRRLNNIRDDQANDAMSNLEMLLVGMWPIHEAREAIVGLVGIDVEVKHCA